MRKVINVITLIIMLGVNIMNPFAYVSSSDIFEENQNVDEAMQENGDFSDEENIEDSENEEDSENVENNEDLEEQDDENTENDEISNEEDEGDNEKDEEIEKENKEEQEENIDKTENTTENQDEENIDKIEEDSGEQENSEKQTENNGSAIDLLKDVVEGSGNILTGEIETLSGDIVEFTGEVEELTGKELELSIARETLNIDPIIGTENTKGVTVNVEAQPGTFPQGTELRIKPITLKKELNEIKDQISDKDENISEESLVAFDITFIYVLSGGEEIEVQPKNGDGVKVVFNYENNENLSEADNNDEQKVKVFHIDDKDENGEKVAQGEEIVRDVTNRVESEEVGIAVADAESFSIYAIVTVSGSIEGNITIIHNLRGGYWIEDGSFESKSIEYSDSDNDGIYTAGTGFKTPSKTGYMFMGWFDEDGNTRWIGENATDGMEIFAKWLEFGDLDVYILSNDTNTNKYHYTLMDRNMGAESQNAIGYYYQWGNNFGFTPGWGKTETGKRGTSGYSWNHPYVNSIFYLNGNNDDGNWINPKNPDLWGGNESDVTHRQGPCPDGYHVPTITDWDGAISKWKNNYTRAYSDFYKDFLIVGVGYLARGTANRAIDGEYSKVRYASSSLNNNGLNKKIVKIFGSDGVNSEPKSNVEERTANGMPVRCFKNTVNSSGEALDLSDIHLDGGVKAMLSIASGVVVAMQNPTKSGWKFDGWYTNDSYEGDAIETGDMVPAGSHLYAKWECQDGYVLDGGSCVKGFKITFNATKNGGITESAPVIVTGGITSKTIDLSNYTAEKTGFYFVGWNTGSDARRGRKGEKTFTESTKLYAIFLDLNTYTFEDEEGNILGTGYYESGEVSDMSKLLTVDYYSDETGDMSHYADLLTLGLDDPSKGWKWTPSLPEDGIATGNLILHGEKLNKYTVTFNNEDGTDFLSYDVLDGTIINEPATHPEKVGYSFMGWYEDEELTTKFNFSSKRITSDTTIYPAFKEVLCTFKIGTYNTGVSINGFSGTQTEDCLTHFVIPSEIEGKPVLRIGEKAFDGTLANAQIISGEIILPDTLTSIGGSAFYNNNISGTLRIPGGITSVTTAFRCNPVEEVIFGEGITTINQDAFRPNNCTTKKTIKKVTFPSTLTSIGKDAFNTQLIEGELELPESLTNIGDSAFYNNNISGTLRIPGGVATVTTAFKCNPVEEVIFGEGITTINQDAFRTNNCTTKKTIKKVTFPSTLTTIRNSVFDGQIIEGELELPESLTSIGDNAFYNNNISGTLRIPGGVTTVTSAFKCNPVEEVIFGEGITTINSETFRTNSCTDKKTIKKVTFPSTLTTIRHMVFDGQIIEGELIIPDNVQTIGNSAFNSNLITGLILGNSVQTIGNSAFNNNKLVGELVIPDSVQTIGNYAFDGNNNGGNKIEGELIIPDSVQTIGEYAFRNNLITGLILGNSVQTISKYAFDRNKIGGEVIIPDSVYTIGEGAFNGNQLTGLILGNSVQTIGKNAFNGNKIEGELIIPDSVVSIGDAAFYNNNISGTLIIPGKINSGIVNDAFRCNPVEEVIFGEGIATINKNAFNTDGCTDKKTIKKVTFPSTLESILDAAFRNQKIEGEFIFPESLTTLGTAVFRGNNISGTLVVPGRLNGGRLNGSFRCNLIENVIIEEGISVIGEGAFYDVNKDGICPKSKHTIKSVQFPSSLTGIESNAFWNNQLTGLILGENVETIGGHAFDNQYNESGHTLKSVILNDKLQNIGYRTFATNDIKSVYIPDSVETLDIQTFDQGNNNLGHKYITGYVTTKKSTLDYTGAFLKPLYQLYTYTFVNENGDILGTGYYPEILTSNTTKLIPLDYYNGIGNINDFTGVDELITSPEGYKVIWSTSLSESSVVTDSLVVTGSIEKVHTVVFKNPFTGDIVEYVPNNQTVLAPEIYEVEGYTFTGWFSGDVKVDFPLTVKSDLILTGRYDISKYTVNFYEDEEQTTPLTGGAFDYNTVLDVENPQKAGRTFGGWYYLSGSEEVFVKLPVVVDKDMDLYAKWGNPVSIVFDANGGKFSDDSTQKTIVYAEDGICGGTTAYSHTSNVNDNGEKISNEYGNYQNRTDVVTIPGAKKLKVTITYQTEAINYDWACVREGSHPEYSGSVDCTERLGGTTTGTKEYIIAGDTVTFGFKSDHNKNNYYGYYAIVTDVADYYTPIVEEPSREGLEFLGWYLDQSGNNPFVMSCDNRDKTVYAKRRGYTGWDGCYEYSILVSTGTEYIAEIINYSGGDSCVKENLSITDKIVRNGREYTIIEISDSAFENKGLSGSLTLPSTIKYVDYKAFSGNQITSLNLNEGLININSAAFANNNILNIIIPNSVEFISAGAFAYNTNLKNITLGSGVKYLNNGVFGGSTDNLESINFGEVEYIYESFQNTKIDSLEIPDSVKYITNGAFYNNQYLKSVIIGDGLETLSEGLFGTNENLESVIIGNGVKYINSAFANCIKLKDITRGGNIETINGGAFYNTAIENLVIPDTVTTINGGAFQNNSKLKTVKIGTGLKNLNAGVFDGSTGIENVDLGKLETIGAGNFSGTQITGLIIPDTVTYIQEGTFQNNTKLKTVKLGTGLEILSSGVFGNCTGIETLDLGRVQSIYAGNFANTQITGLVIPDTVTYISNGAFSNNTKLKTVKLGTGLQYLYNGVFGNCTGIETLDLGRVQSISAGNFVNTQITGLVIPDTVTYIQGGAFADNTKLKTIKFGTGLKNLHIGVFSGSFNIESLDLGKLETIDNYNFSGTQLTGLVIPDTVTKIYSYSFVNNTKLRTVTFGKNIELISDQAFANSALTGISLPNSLTTLGNSTFCIDDGTNTGTVIGFIGDNPTTSAEDLESQDDTACFVIKKSIYNISTGSNDETQGSVSVYGEPRYGKRIEFRANVHDTSLYKFVKWELNGHFVTIGDNEDEYWTGDLVIENLTGDLIVTGHFAAYSGCSWSGGEIAHGTSVTGYLTPTVSYGETCVSEIRTCNDGTLSGTYEYASCTPEGASSCDLPWGGTTGHGAVVTGYKTESETCPNSCKSQQATCNNGSWDVEGFTGTYTKSSCITQPVVIPEDYILDVCPAHGNCSSITGYTVNEYACVKGEEKYRLDSCEVHYHTGSDNKSCEIDRFDIVWKYRDDNGGRTGETKNIEYGKPVQTPSYPTTIQTAQTGYTFTGWNPEVISPVTTGAEYTAQYEEIIREYLIKFIDGDGEIIQTGMVAYGATPAYTGEIPTKTATAQYSYSFNNTWEPEIVPVTTGAEYTAQFDSILNKYTVTINVNTNSGSVSTGSVTENWGSLITENGNELTIGDTTVIATAKTGDAQYIHEFSRWNNTCGDKVETGCSIEAEFTSTIREYTITFHSNGGSVVTGQTKQYGSHVDEPADPTRQGYGFSGWYSNISLTQKYNFTETVTGDLDLYAKWTPITYTIGYELNGGILPAGQENPTTYTIESNDITLKNPTRIGYIFSGWTGTDLSTESTEVTIASGSMGDRVYYANWQPDNVNVTVYYFTQKLNPSTNELIDEFDTHDIRIVQMQSDLEFNIYNEFYKPIEGFEYVRATVTEQDTSEHTETTTTVLPNGSRVINLYYTRGQYNFAIIPVDNVTTQGSSENSGYYYGATITLSGSSSNDCFMWSGWTNLPEGTINNSQTSFTMPANAISLSGVVTEKTYNISFNGNGADEGEMETLNGISCTQSIYLPINKFKKVGHTFTGWTTTIDGSKEYNDGARIQALTTGNNTTVNLIAVWDINKYDIIWKNYNGETLDSQILEYGVIPEYGGEYPLRDPDIQFSYSFSGWTPEIQRVEGPQVYTAVYSTTLNEYTITWDVDGTITTETYEYGAIPYFSGSKGKVPDKQYIYTFSGWTPQISPVSGNITYTATYTATLRKYTVTWINSNGDVLEIDENVPYGTTPTYDGPTPTKEGDTEHHYTFAGWAPAVGPISGDTTYEAIFDSTKKEYTIIWQNENGGILETDEDVPYGTMPSYDGPTPTKASDAQYSYEFAGWTPETGAVVGHQTYTATYTAIPRKYTVTWKNSNGSVIRTDTGVKYGTTLEYQGPTPTSGGNAQYSYEFTGWNPAIGEIHGDTTYTAVYTHKTNKYTITWKNRDGTVIKTVTGVEYGATPIYGDVSPTKTGDAQYSYEFIGWDPGISTVTGDTSYTAKFKENLNRYKVIFINDDSGILKEATEYDYGTSRDDIEKPADPTKASDVQYSYEFAGWDPSISVLTGDITFKATYTSTVNKYTVTWKNRNGSIIKTNTGVEYGTEPEYDGPTPTKESTSEYSYRFTGWEPAIGEIHGDTTYTAQFEPILESYTITWKDRDGKVLKVDENVPYGVTPVYSGDNPSRSGNIQYDYIFDGWTPSLVPVHGDATYTAKYRSELKKYKVIWKNWDDEVLETDENVLYGSTPKYDGEEPTKPGSPQYSYVFDRWTPNIHAVDGDVVYKAVFEELINKYTVTWENWDESVIKTDTGVEYGTVLEYDGPTPTKEGDAQYSYEFSGWDNEIKAIHEDTTYRATYIQSVNEYLITFLDGDGKTIQTGMVAYGDTPSYTGSTPTKAKTQEYTYTFNNTWSPEIHSVGGEETYTAQFNSTKNKYTITINANTNSGSINTGLITAEYGTPITESGNELKIGDTTVIATAKPSDAQYTHEFSGWNNTCGLTLNDGCTIEAEFRSIVNKYLITFLDGDGKTIQTGMVAYGATPNYTGSTPTKTKTQEYTYTFNGNWSPAIHSVTTGETYTAQFNSTKNKYTITINANTNSGSINTGLITAEYGTSITESGNELKIGDTTIIATAKPSDAQYTHEFSGWNNTCGLTLNDGCIIEAEFRSIIHKYTVIWNNEDGMQLEKDENVPYGTMPQYNGTTPVKPGDGSGAYVFDGWNPNPTIVVGNVEYTAKYKEKTSPQDDNTGNRRSGGGRKHTTSQEIDQHGSAEDIDNPSNPEKEVFDAYKRAYKYGITTIDNEQKADPNGYVTRGHLAKMVVNFTVNVLGRDMPVDTPTKCKRNDDDSEWKSSEIKFYAEKSCALGVMGLYTKKFMPNKIVDRAEFGTVVSRILWGDKYNELDTRHHLYFTKHLKALHENGFMKDIDNPLGRKEFRKRVWLVLKRIELEKNMK